MPDIREFTIGGGGSVEANSFVLLRADGDIEQASEPLPGISGVSLESGENEESVDVQLTGEVIVTADGDIQAGSWVTVSGAGRVRQTADFDRAVALALTPAPDGQNVSVLLSLPCGFPD